MATAKTTKTRSEEAWLDAGYERLSLRLAKGTKAMLKRAGKRLDLKPGAVVTLLVAEFLSGKRGAS